MGVGFYFGKNNIDKLFLRAKGVFRHKGTKALKCHRKSKGKTFGYATSILVAYHAAPVLRRAKGLNGVHVSRYNSPVRQVQENSGAAWSKFEPRTHLHP